MSGPGDRAGGDEGRIALLSLAFGLLAVVLVLVVVSASAVHLQRKRLYALADACARDAADALDEDRYYAHGDVLLTDASVRASARDHLRAHADLAGVVVGAGTGTADGRTARVELVLVTAPPFTAFVPARFARVQVVARSSAVADLR
ncbi:pilus assembly protein TadG-related protein [Kineococcus sp. SYSU DK002]|uniref:pilus assembly protein TadG-related protein n=1 Tax=Kineococcus sp. SYSU DK002 TaxID=3383123 RepID=UPI003D7C97E3